MLHLKKFSDFLLKSLFQKKTTKYRVKHLKNIDCPKNGTFYKRIDVTDNGTKKVLHYRTMVLLCYIQSKNTVVLPTYENKQWHYEMQIGVVTFLCHNFFITSFSVAIMFVFICSLTVQNCSKIYYARHLGLFSYFSLLMVSMCKE